MSDVYDDRPPRVAPHPRIRQRRVEVKRDEGRRRLRFLIGGVGVLAALALSFGATRSPLFDVDTVHVRGSVHTSLEDVLRASGLASKPPLVDLDEHRLEQRIERLPWIDGAQVSRDWPGTVNVTVTERIPLAAVPLGADRWAITDVSGRVLSVEAAPGDLTRVEAAGVPAMLGATVPASVRPALRIVDALPEVLSGRVAAIRVGEGGVLTLVLDGKVPVELGPPTELPDKLVALTTLVAKADLRRVRSVDVRVPTAPVLTRG